MLVQRSAKRGEKDKPTLSKTQQPQHLGLLTSEQKEREQETTEVVGQVPWSEYRFLVRRKPRGWVLPALLQDSRLQGQSWLCHWVIV